MFYGLYLIFQTFISDFCFAEKKSTWEDIYLILSPKLLIYLHLYLLSLIRWLRTQLRLI